MTGFFTKELTLCRLEPTFPPMKNQIREEIKEKRRTLSEINRERKSHQIFEKFISLPEIKEAKNILVYVSYGEEVVTHFMIKRLLQTDKVLYTPKVDGDNIIACRLDHWEDLEFGTFGILEPKEVIEIKHPSELDLIMVPGVAFTEKGDRMGLGKGFYDRFLDKCPATKVGLAYDEQIINELPIEDHDVPMDIIITDSTIIRP